MIIPERMIIPGRKIIPERMSLPDGSVSPVTGPEKTVTETDLFQMDGFPATETDLFQMDGFPETERKIRERPGQSGMCIKRSICRDKEYDEKS